MPERDLKCPVCDSAASVTESFCSVCGQAFVTICPHCDHNVSVWSDQCSYCGKPVDHHLRKKPSEPGSEEEGRELQRLQAEERTLSSRLEHLGDGKARFILRTLFVMFFQLAVLGAVIWFLALKIAPQFEESLREYYALYPIYVVLAGLVVAGCVLFFLYEILSKGLKAVWERIQRDKTTRSSLQTRLSETRKRIQEIEGPRQ